MRNRKCTKKHAGQNGKGIFMKENRMKRKVCKETRRFQTRKGNEKERKEGKMENAGCSATGAKKPA